MLHLELDWDWLSSGNVELLCEKRFIVMLNRVVCINYVGYAVFIGVITLCLDCFR